MNALRSLVVLGLLAACGGNDARYLVSAGAPGTETRVAAGSIEVRDVSLPTYAAASEIVVQDADGALRAVKRSVWADDPIRDVTGALAQRLDARSTATVAASPWPLTNGPDATLDVRVSEMVASVAGTFTLRGQYAISSPDGRVRERLERFDIRVPLADTNPATVAAATGAALDALAEDIIRRLSR